MQGAFVVSEGKAARSWPLNGRNHATQNHVGELDPEKFRGEPREGVSQLH